MLRLLTFVLVSAIAAMAQITERTNVTMINGRAWELLPAPTKAAYLQGIRDGLIIAVSNLPENLSKIGIAVLDENQARGFGNEDYREELDTFYKDRENVPIGLPLAYQYITLKLKGRTTKQELERRLIEVRKIVSN
jgi:hypothetical protein